jgi:hypothetical protein
MQKSEWVNLMSTQIVSDPRQVLARANTNLYVEIYTALYTPPTPSFRQDLFASPVPLRRPASMIAM